MSTHLESIRMYTPVLVPLLLRRSAGSDQHSFSFFLQWVYQLESSSTWATFGIRFSVDLFFTLQGIYPFHPLWITRSSNNLTSLFLVSVADHSKYYQLYLTQGVGMGIGAGFLYMPSLAVQSYHWRERRAMAMGIVVVGKSYQKST